MVILALLCVRGAHHGDGVRLGDGPCGEQDEVDGVAPGEAEHHDEQDDGEREAGVHHPAGGEHELAQLLDLHGQQAHGHGEHQLAAHDGVHLAQEALADRVRGDAQLLVMPTCAIRDHLGDRKALMCEGVGVRV